ncbi:MAG: prepilin peptidase [Candidatus Aenigmatarchaeota archaeon]
MFQILIFLVIVVFFFFVFSYKDFTRGTIPNRYVALFLVIGFLVQVYQGNIIEEPIRVLGVFLYGALGSFTLWFLGLISAGDSKLLTSLFLYFPFRHYTRALPLDFLINLFVPVFIFLVVYLLLRSDRKAIVKSLVSSFRPYQVAMVFVILVGFSWFVSTFFGFLGLDIGYFGLVLALFMGYELLFRFSSGRTELVFLFLAGLRAALDYKNALTLRFFAYMSLFTLFFVVVRLFTLKLSFRFFSENKDLSELEEGDVLAEGIVEREGEYKKESLLDFSLIGYMRSRKKKFIHGLGPITDEDVQRIKQLYSEGKLHFEKLKVQRTQRFAPFVFFGYFLTFFLGTNFLTFISILV